MSTLRFHTKVLRIRLSPEDWAKVVVAAMDTDTSVEQKINDLLTEPLAALPTPDEGTIRVVMAGMTV